MKRRITLSIALVLSVVLVSLMSSDSTVKAQQPQRFRFDTGVLLLGPNQELRVTVATGDVNAEDSINIRFRQINYDNCSPKLCIASQTTSDPVRVAPNEAAYFNVGPDVHGNRVVVLSNSRNVKVLGIVFDTSTQRFVAQIEFEMLN
jgi:hypothetical protein